MAAPASRREQSTSNTSKNSTEAEYISREICMVDRQYSRQQRREKPMFVPSENTEPTMGVWLSVINERNKDISYFFTSITTDENVCKHNEEQELMLRSTAL